MESLYVPRAESVVASGSLAAVHGYRFFRIRFTLSATPGNLPQVDDITVNWSYDVL